MELIYTDRARGFEKGKNYRNPRFFDRIEKSATSVVIEGNFPKVKEAYEKAGIKVSALSDPDSKQKAKTKAPQPKAEPKE